jgi:hypothetical protein
MESEMGPLRGGVNEDIQHLFFQCPFMVQVWQRMGISWISYRDAVTFWSSFCRGNASEGGITFRSKKDRAKVLVVLWGIWLGRNGVLFRGRDPMSRTLFLRFPPRWCSGEIFCNL